ncbi:SusE domain-containing protein [Mucilaginibacter sp. AW1-7]|jgi:hypothetical protein|uniref:SusE domain-containing protein n=1 Tax=unclassified Mucilaginibacter TaxID=2617802 RepID=UPI002366B944|nr:SusE domain-containing protein [Mucilaginibacter sp. KACC 22773]WDF80181.1 SusE domain-containing protein [Mucilaginibacter sp. KACC 22773]
MKKNLNRVLAIGSITLLMLTSCKKDESNKVVASSNTKAGTLSASETTLVLTKANQDKTAITFTLQSPNYGFSAAVTNTLQISASSDFSSPKEVAIGTKVTTKSYTVLDFNAMILALNLSTGVNSTVQARLKTQLTGATATPIYSNVVTLNVTPYALISFLYVPGAYQGWKPETADSLQSATSNGVYTGVINFTAGNLEYKITPAKVWTNSYGITSAGVVTYNGGDNFKVPSAGSYFLTLDLNKNTMVAKQTLWAVIGDATPGGWGGDTDLQFSNATQQWIGTIALIGGKQLKFRLNHDWGVNFGATGSTLVAGGDNINVSASGTYKVVLDLNANTYSLTKL